MTLGTLRADAQLPIEELVALVRRDTAAFEQLIAAEVDTSLGGVALGLNVAREVLHVALTGELPDPDETELPATASTLAGVYAQAIESCIAHVESADPDAFLDVTWTHPTYGPLNWREWFAFLAHDARTRVAGITGGG